MSYYLPKDSIMQKKLTVWIWLREIIIFCFFWPFLPLLALGKIIEDAEGMKHSILSYISWLVLLYFLFGWYLAYRIYRERIKDYLPPIKKKPYSIRKEIGLFIFIWPILPILLLIVAHLLNITFQITSSVLENLITFLLLFGWGLALCVFLYRRKYYLNTQLTDSNVT